MSKLEEFKVAFEAVPAGDWRYADELSAVVYISGHKVKFAADLGKIDDSAVKGIFIALAHKLTPSMLEAAALVAQARRLIAEAMDTHIYNEADGDQPAGNCAYAKFLKDADQLAEKFNVSHQ